jgi:uncharacterized phage protein (TIGR02216 family)
MARMPSPRTPFPFTRAMAFGLCVLRLAPNDFWSMTPHELLRASEGVYGRHDIAPSRPMLDDLITRFPDKEKSI